MNKKTILGYAIGPIGSGLLGFISLPIITWFYSVEDVGRISMLFVFTNFSILLFCFGLDQAYVREYHESDNKAALLKAVMLPCIFFSAIFFIIILLFDNQFISKFIFDIPSTYLSILVAICFIFALISRFLSLILRMQERSVAFSMSQLLPKIIFILIIVSTVWFSIDRNTYNLVTANIISIILACFIFLWNTRKEWVEAIKENIDFTYLKQLLKFGYPLIAAGLAAWGLNVMDKVFLRHYSSYNELGIYSITMSVAAVVTIFAGIFNTIWSPTVYKWIANAEYDDKKMEKTLNYLLVFVYFFIVLVGLFSWIISYLLPKSYYQVQYLLPICLLAPIFYTISEVTGIGITISRKTKFSLLCSFVAMFVSIILNYILVKDFGAKGAAISTASAFFIFLLMRTYVSNILWVKRSYLKLFSVLFVLYMVCLSHLIFENSNYILTVVWLILMIIGVVLYKKYLRVIFQFFKGFFCRHLKN